jgi:hypothetical protein
LKVSDAYLKRLEDVLAANSTTPPPDRLSCYMNEQISFVVETWKEYSGHRQKIRITAFVKELKKRWRRQSWLTPPPSRQTVADMLNGNDIRVPETVTKKMKYHEPVTRFFPNAQACLDGKQIDITINDHPHRFMCEFVKDLASDAITAAEFGKTETAELVEKAFRQHSQIWGVPLSVLVDNGSGNKKAMVTLGQEGTLVIWAYPQRPESNGQIEGTFGHFERLTSPIVIDGLDEETMALSFAKATVEMYAVLRNQTPRCSQCPFTPEELMSYQAGDLKMEEAFDFLSARQDQKKLLKERRLRISQERQELMESIVKEQRLRGDLVIFKKTLSHVESQIIRQAEIAFAVQAGQDHFDESKRTMMYFCGIAKNMQDKKDQQKKEETARRRYGLDQKSRKYREETLAAQREFQERKEFEKKPWVSLVKNLVSETRLAPEFKRFSIFRNQIDRALSFMIEKGDQRFATMLDKAERMIMDLAEFSLPTRFEMVKFVKERINKLTIPEAKTVTL